MLDKREIDEVLENLRKSNDTLDIWMIVNFDVFAEFGSVFVYTEDFEASDYLEILQIMMRFFEKKNDGERFESCMNLYNNFLREKTIAIDPYIMHLALNFLNMRDIDKYN